MNNPPKTHFAGNFNMMKSTFKICQIFLLMCGVFGADADEVKSMSVMEGDSVTLNPGPAQTQGFFLILWRFGEKGSTIAQIDRKKISYPSHTEIFSDRLQLDNQTGSLTIKNMRTNHTGDYKLQIDYNTGSQYKQKFSVTVYESPFVVAGAEAELKIVSAMEGDPVTLQTGVTESHGNELIVWRFGDEGKLIAKSDNEAKSSPLYDKTDERFRDRLKLDQTGSLTITNTRTTDTGVYKVKISSNKQTLYKTFIVTVSVPDSGVSPGAVAGIVIIVALLVSAAAGVMYYLRPRITNLPSQKWSVPVTDVVTLNPETDIQRGDKIQWLFGNGDTPIAEIKGETKINERPDTIFRNCLKLDKTTGSLTINDINTEHTGLYTLKIRRGRENLCKKFFVYVEESLLRDVIEGDPVNLTSDTAIHEDEEVQWLFADKERQTVLAGIKNKEVTLMRTDERFRDGLNVDRVTYEMTITNFTSAHAGFYTLKIKRAKETLYKRFDVYCREREIAVMEGEDVTLKSATEIHKDDLIRWLYRDEEKETVIAEIKGEKLKTYDNAPDGRFEERLNLDKNTLSLTIKNTRTEHSGRYHLRIKSSHGDSDKTFIVTVKVKSEKKFLNEGESLTLNPDTEIQRDDLMLWMFGAKDKLIAQIKKERIYDERFKGRLKLDKKTGSLTITNITTEHTGLYKLLTISSRKGILFKKFKVIIHLREESSKKENNENQMNESVSLEMPLLNEDDLDVMHEEEGTSSL